MEPRLHAFVEFASTQDFSSHGKPLALMPQSGRRLMLKSICSETDLWTAGRCAGSGVKSLNSTQRTRDQFSERVPRRAVSELEVAQIGSKS